MKITTMLIAAAAVTVAMPSTAIAARWQTINERKVMLQHRIDVGVRNGSLNRAEASRLRTQFANLQRLEYRYRRNGLTYAERTDLDRRFNMLSQHIRMQRNDRQTRGNRMPNRVHR